MFQTHLIWPASAANGQPRTMEVIQDTLAEFDLLSDEEKEGLLGYSPFLDYPGFDFINGFPCEYLHHVCLGVTKRLLELSFAVGEIRKRITKRKLSSTKLFNERMRVQKVTSECSRRGRNMDFKVMKGEEFRNLTLFFFPHIIDSIESSQGKTERKLWLLYVFQIRAFVLPEEEFSNVQNEDIQYCCDQFCVIFEQLFGTSNSSYNIRMMSHLRQVRERGKLTDTSTFKHESYYGEMRRSYVPGTPSTGKQILKSAYIRRSIPHKNCQKPLKLSPKQTSRSCDNLIYIFTNNKYKFYVIKKILQNGSFLCVQFGKRQYDPPEISLKWADVGVFLKSGETEIESIFERREITGKAIIVSNLIITCPTNILQE